MFCEPANPYSYQRTFSYCIMEILANHKLANCGRLQSCPVSSWGYVVNDRKKDTGIISWAFTVAREANDDIRSIIYARELNYDQEQLHIKRSQSKADRRSVKGLQYSSWKAVMKTVTLSSWMHLVEQASALSSIRFSKIFTHWVRLLLEQFPVGLLLSA